MDIATLLEVTYDGDKGLRIFELCNFIESKGLEKEFEAYLRQQVIDCADSHHAGEQEWARIVLEVDFIEHRRKTVRG